MSPLSARDRRALRLGAWVAVPALAWSLVARPLGADIATLRDALAAERTALAREQAALAAMPRGGAAAPAQLARALAPRLFTGRDDVIAAAALATYLGDHVDAADLLLLGSTTRPAASMPAGGRAVQVEVQAEGDVQGLVRFLELVATGDRLVQLHALEVEVRAGPDGAAGDAELLGMRATATGYVAPRVERQPEAPR